MNESIVSPLFFEKILLRYIFTDLEVRDKILPFIVEDIFDDFSVKENIRTIIKFVDEHSKFPTIPEMKMEIKNKEANDVLVESLDIDTSEYDRSYILNKIEDFFKRKMILNDLTDAATKLKEDDLGILNDTPDKLREKLAFTFNNDIGLNVFSETGRDKFFNFLHNKDKTISTGISYLDKIISGGFHEKSLSLIMSESNLGKSLIMCSLATTSLLNNKNVLYITLEMSEEKITERILANSFDLDINQLQYLTKDAFNTKFDTLASKIDKKLIIKEYAPRSLNASRIRNLLKELKIKQQFVPDIVFVDYMGLMVPINSKNIENTYGEQKRVSEELRAIAVEETLTLVSAVQTNRGGFSNSTLDLTDISDSIGTVATADLIIGVMQSDEYRAAGKYRWIILKNRYGLNKIPMNICVDYPKMRIFGDESEENNSELKTVSIVDDAAVDILKSVKTEKKKKLSDLTGGGIEM